jgi:hypothetical protein
MSKPINNHPDYGLTCNSGAINRHEIIAAMAEALKSAETYEHPTYELMAQAAYAVVEPLLAQLQPAPEVPETGTTRLSSVAVKLEGEA